MKKLFDFISATRQKQLDIDLFHAAKAGDEDTVRRLVGDRADINAGNPEMDGITPLHLAVQYHNTALFDLLLELGANITAKDNQGMTPLHWAVIKGYSHGIHTLAKKGANLLQPDKYGRNCLDMAKNKAESETRHVVAELISRRHARQAKSATRRHPAGKNIGSLNKG